MLTRTLQFSHYQYTVGKEWITAFKKVYMDSIHAYIEGT